MTRLWILAAMCSVGLAASSSIVVPNASATTAGNDNSGLPADYFFYIRSQTVVDPDQFSSITGPVYITGMAFRAAPGMGSLNLEASGSISLSTSLTYANTTGHPGLSLTFANNVGPDNTLVFSGSAALTGPGCAGPAPCPFGPPVAFTAPFLYNPANGPLLFDMTDTFIGVTSGQIDIQDCNPASCSVSGIDSTTPGAAAAPQVNASGTIMEIFYVPAAQSTTNVTLNLTFSSIGATVLNQMNAVESGSAGSLGNATLYITSSQPKSSGALQGPVQVTAQLFFDQLDSITASFTESNVNFAASPPFTISGGTITGGTGMYGGASGSLSLTFNQNANGVYTTTGSGSVTVNGTTTQLTLSNFAGSSIANAQEYYSGGTATGTASPLGSASATLKIDNANTPPEPSIGVLTVRPNATDSFNIYFSVSGLTSGGPSFPATVTGGTGAYAGATGSFMLALGGNSTSGYTIQGTGTLTSAASGVPIITSVKTAFGAPVVAYNTWLQINGINLAPSSTASAGVVWSNASSFAQNMMPSQLGPISVTVDGLPAYIFFYCSASTDPACTAGDQINVLAPLDTNNVPYPVEVVVTNNGVASAPFTVLNNGLSPTFPLYDATGHVVARHLNYNLLGPASLFPGSSTPATPGEEIILVLYGLGPPSGTAPTAGSATQSGSMPSPIQCWISGQPASVVGFDLISPGLYQLNITVPASTPAGDNPIACNYNGYPTFPGALINVQ